MQNNPKVIVAIDAATDTEARAIVSTLNPDACRLKVANTLFTHYGPALVSDFIQQGFDVFLDLKYYDIPHQVAGACRAAAELGVWMVNLHVSGGERMMCAAVDALSDYPAKKRPLLIGVTILTSMNEEDLTPLGQKTKVADLVLSYAKLAKISGLDGVVCSAQEATAIRQHIGNDFVLVTPGIRLTEDSHDDQKRIMTPTKAIEAGSTYLVIGRPITQASNPNLVLSNINNDLLEHH